MKTARSRNRPAAGLKLLLTAGALAATLGGWAVLAAGEDNPAASAPPPVTATAYPAPAEAGPVLEIAPTLRVVSVPPAAVGRNNPVTVTRSSR